ncbi:MAG TPA: cobalamin-binding protein [Chloroflexia bacterium]|nr:cobalamin-binding protein [Chloroflexia bacterium]
MLALLLTLVLAACGDTTATTAPAATTASTTTAAATTAASTTAAATTATATTVASTTAASTTAAASTAASTTAPATTAAATATTAASSTTTASGASSTTSYPVTVTDDAKRSVTLEKAPSRIISLAPSNTELLYSLGLGESIVGVDTYSNYPPEAAKKEKIGDLKTNLEKVVSLNPDLVLAAGITAQQTISDLQAKGVKVMVLNPSNLAGVVTDIKLLAKATNTTAKGESVASDFQKKLDDVAAKVKSAGSSPRVFYELDPTLFTIGPGSFIDDMIQKAGGQNIVTDGSNPYPQLNQETVISKDPQVILVGDDSGGEDTPDKILARPGWSGISAIKNKRVYAINADLVNRPGPRAADGVVEIAKALYPDLFK